MGLSTIYKVKGFSSTGSYVPGNQKVWDYYKFKLSDEALEGLKHYWRCPSSLGNLYQSLLLFDTPAVNKLPTDPIFDKCYEFVTEAFRPDVPYRICKLQNVIPSDLPQSTNPGFPYVQSGFKTKAEAWNTAFDHAWMLFDKAARGRPFSFFPDMIFAKGAITTRDKIKTRFINGVSLSTLLIECCFAKAIEKHQFSGATPAAYIYTPFNGGYSEYRNDISECTKHFKKRTQFITLDFKSYDKKGIVDLTFMIYETYKSYFDWTQDDRGDPLTQREIRAYERLLYAVAYNHVYTKMIMPDGYVYQKDKGDNSGSKMFQKIQNFRTCLLNVLVVYDQYAAFPDFVRTLGDDSTSAKVLSSGSHKFDLDRAAEYLAMYDTELSIDKCVVTEDIDKVEFLGRNLFNYQSTRETAEILLRILYPAREDKSDVDLAIRIVAMFYENSGGNRVLCDIMRKMFQQLIPYEIREALSRKDDVWTPHLKKLFKMMGLPKAPKCCLPEPAELWFLVHAPRRDKPCRLDELFTGPCFKMRRLDFRKRFDLYTVPRYELYF